MDQTPAWFNESRNFQIPGRPTVPIRNLPTPSRANSTNPGYEPQRQRSTIYTGVAIVDWHVGHRDPAFADLLESRGYITLFHGGGTTAVVQTNDTRPSLPGWWPMMPEGRPMTYLSRLSDDEEGTDLQHPFSGNEAISHTSTIPFRISHRTSCRQM